MIKKVTVLGCLADLCVKFQVCIHMLKLHVRVDFSCVQDHQLGPGLADAGSVLSDALGSLCPILLKSVPETLSLKLNL